MDNSVLKAGQEVFELVDDLSNGDPNISTAIMTVVSVLIQTKAYKEQLKHATGKHLGL